MKKRDERKMRISLILERRKNLWDTGKEEEGKMLHSLQDLGMNCALRERVLGIGSEFFTFYHQPLKMLRGLYLP